MIFTVSYLSKSSLESEIKMNNPFGPQPNPFFPSADVKKRMLQRVQSSKVDDRIFQVVQNAYEEALRMENVLLSRPERTRLFSQILKAVLEDMVKKLDNHEGKKTI
jgi:hypothetical protein